MISEPLRNPLSLFDVKDKVAIITGASGTFGRATALALTALGGKVLLASGSKSELDEAAGGGARTRWRTGHRGAAPRQPGGPRSHARFGPRHVRPGRSACGRVGLQQA